MALDKKDIRAIAQIAKSYATAGSGISDVVDDTSPQLGGTLDMNGNGISTGAVTISPTELGYVNNVSSNIQTQIDAKAATSHNHATSDINSGTFADARIAESNVTQHQAALSITESQISDLSHDISAASDTTAGKVELATTAEIDTGTDNARAITPLGLASSALQTKVDGIETGATADQTGAEIKTAYEAEADTNAYTDAEKSKLAGIEAGADVTDTTNVTAAGALMDSEVTNLAQVKAFNSADYATASHTHTESDITDLDHDATKIQGVTVDNTDIGNGKYLAYNSVSGNLEYEALAGGGDMSTSTYDGAGVSEQLVGLTASQTLTNKTLSTGSTIDANVVVTEVLKKVYPVGVIYTNITGTNPATELGFGTWVAFGAGRVPVGYDAGDTDFDTAEETGGSKTHTLTTDEMPSHSHTTNAPVNAGVRVISGYAELGTHANRGTTNNTTTATTASSGGGSAHTIVQPYIVVHMWKRTA